MAFPQQRTDWTCSTKGGPGGDYAGRVQIVARRGSALGARAFLKVSQCARGGCCFVQILDDYFPA
jgi:hypothetical protein